MASYSFITEQKHFWFDSSTAFVVIFPKTTIRVSFCEVLLRLGCVYENEKKKTSAVRAARSESIVIHLFIIYLITFTTAEKQAVVAVAQQSKAPN